MEVLRYSQEKWIKALIGFVCYIGYEDVVAELVLSCTSGSKNILLSNTHFMMDDRFVVLADIDPEFLSNNEGNAKY